MWLIDQLYIELVYKTLAPMPAYISCSSFADLLFSEDSAYGACLIPNFRKECTDFYVLKKDFGKENVGKN